MSRIAEPLTALPNTASNASRSDHLGDTAVMTQPPPRPDSVDPKLLDILVCPVTKSRLEYDPERQELISRAARLAYPIRDGIPIMLPEEARKID